MAYSRMSANMQTNPLCAPLKLFGFMMMQDVPMNHKKNSKR